MQKKEMIYPGSSSQPCKGFYEISFLPGKGDINYATVLITENYKGGPRHTQIDHSHDTLTNVLNRILEQDLKGVRLDFIEFYYQWGQSETRVSRIEYNFDQVSFALTGGKHIALYSGLYRDLKSWIMKLFGGYLEPDMSSCFSTDVLAGFANAIVNCDPQQVSEQKKNDLQALFGF